MFFTRKRLLALARIAGRKDLVGRDDSPHDRLVERELEAGGFIARRAAAPPHITTAGSSALSAHVDAKVVHRVRAVIEIDLIDVGEACRDLTLLLRARLPGARVVRVMNASDADVPR